MGPSPHDHGGALTIFADTWERGLRAFSPQEIAAGLEACLSRSDPWPPSLPEFRLLCLQLPTLAQVRREIREKGQGLSPLALMVWRSLDVFAYRIADSRYAETLLREAYNEATTALLRGEKLPEPCALLEDKAEPARPATPETAERCLREMRATLGMIHD